MKRDGEPQPNELLIELLDYIEQVEKLKKRATFVVPTEYLCSYEADITGLPGVEFNLVGGGDDIWARIPRLKEIGPPDLEPALEPWVLLSKSPDKAPAINNEITSIELPPKFRLPGSGL